MRAQHIRHTVIPGAGLLPMGRLIIATVHIIVKVTLPTALQNCTIRSIPGEMQGHLGRASVPQFIVLQDFPQHRQVISTIYSVILSKTPIEHLLCAWHYSRHGGIAP